MPGVRLAHETLRGQTLVLVHPTKRYRVPYLCPRCNEVHERKTVHLDLDGEGTVIVSPGVFEELREMGLPGLRVMNEVRRPPAQVISVGGSVAVIESRSRMEVQVAGGRLTVLKNKLLAPRRDRYG